LSLIVLVLVIGLRFLFPHATEGSNGRAATDKAEKRRKIDYDYEDENEDD